MQSSRCARGSLPAARSRNPGLRRWSPRFARESLGRPTTASGNPRLRCCYSRFARGILAPCFARRSKEACPLNPTLKTHINNRNIPARQLPSLPPESIRQLIRHGQPSTPYARHISPALASCLFRKHNLPAPTTTILCRPVETAEVLACRSAVMSDVAGIFDGVDADEEFATFGVEKKKAERNRFKRKRQEGDLLGICFRAARHWAIGGFQMSGRPEPSRAGRPPRGGVNSFNANSSRGQTPYLRGWRTTCHESIRLFHYLPTEPISSPHVERKRRGLSLEGAAACTPDPSGSRIHSELAIPAQTGTGQVQSIK